VITFVFQEFSILNITNFDFNVNFWKVLQVSIDDVQICTC